MKNAIWIIIGLLSVAVSANGQQFKKRFQLSLDESLTNIQTDWIALDRDTLLDLVVTGIAADGQMKIIAYQNNLGISLVKKFAQPTGFKSGTLQLADWNSDNRIDLMVAGKTLIDTDALFVFENIGDSSFQKSTSKLLDHASFFRVADLNQDGRLDLISAGTQNTTSFLRIYQNTPSGLTLVFDTLGISITDLVVFDFNKDTKNDFVLTGKDATQQSASILFSNRDNFRFKVQELPAPVLGKLSSQDYNNDGFFDLFVAGLDRSGKHINRIWINKIDSFSVEETYPSLQKPELFTGDMNSDGRADQLINGYDGQNRKVNFIFDPNILLTDLDTTGLLVQRLGDFDRDGDLDLLQIIDSVGQSWIKYYKNAIVVENQRPGIPSQGFAISAFNKTFIYWEAPQDDHTASSSLTYDVWLGTNQSTLITPSFDLDSKRRMAVLHGNAGTNTSQIIQGLTDNRYYYEIQSVDNAYNGSYGICTGGVIPCFDLVHENIQSCKTEEVTLIAGSQAYWFSLSKGFLGIFEKLKFTAIENDTIFSFVPQGLDCSKNTVWFIHVNDGSLPEQEIIYACEDKPIRLGIAPGWNNIEWKTEPVIAGLDSIDFLLSKVDTILVTAKSQNTCTYQKEFILRVSQLQLTLNGEVFQLLKGNSVQLEASSTATQFKWMPPSGLSNDTIPNPIATPAQTTDYMLIVTDSIGCTLEGRVQIQVEETAFIPNLFTPNGDGKNDVLLVYGLTQAASFIFRIYNREGNVMYEASDIKQAASNGWNGQAHGTLQPSGIYYWKVEGKTSNGEQLLLNGKKTGSILLVH
ncbi:MAG: VCBS repeat-containing protein [Bacteroidia bacterium]|nr:VCBS repeat-containing protein [Bacteroidia bacterium]